MKAPSIVALTLLLAGHVSAQPIAPGSKIGLVQFLRGSYGGLKRNLIQTAEKMPADDYGFKPGPTQDVRTFGQVIAHVAAAQFSTCAAAKDVPDPNAGRDLEHTLKTKADFVKALADSFAFCDEVFESLTDARAGEFVKQGPAEVVRGAVLVGLIGHSGEMYGVSTVYLRAKGLVPPATERTQQMRRPGGK
jgi:hypothetical protein